MVNLWKNISSQPKSQSIICGSCVNGSHPELFALLLWGDWEVEDLDGAQSFLLDRSGDEVVSRLDAAALGRVASSGGGELLRSDEDDAMAVYWREALLPFAARHRMAAGEADVVQRFWWPLLGGVLLWMLKMCLPERTR